MNTLKSIAAATLMIAASGSAMAELGGSATGRTMDMQANQGNTAESFFRNYSDATEMGGRVTHRYNEQVLVYGDFAKFETEIVDGLDAEGDGFGAGLFYFLPGKLEGYDVAARASYHTQDGSSDSANLTAGGLTLNNATFDLDGTRITAELLLSPIEALKPNGLTWYAGLGVSKTEADLKLTSGNTSVNIAGVTGKQSATEVIGSLGLVLPTSFGSAFAGIDYEDGSAITIGARYQF